MSRKQITVTLKVKVNVEEWSTEYALDPSQHESLKLDVGEHIAASIQESPAFGNAIVSVEAK